MRRPVAIIAFALASVLACGAWAQEATSSYRVVENPFGEEFAYRVPNDLRPMIEVEQVRFSLLRIAPREGKSIVPGKNVPFTMTVELENVGDKDQEVLVVALLEDEKARPLERLQMPAIRIKDGRTATETEKYKLDGQILQDTAKIWLLFEVVE